MAQLLCLASFCYFTSAHFSFFVRLVLNSRWLLEISLWKEWPPTYQVRDEKNSNVQHGWGSHLRSACVGIFIIFIFIIFIQEIIETVCWGKYKSTYTGGGNNENQSSDPNKHSLLEVSNVSSSALVVLYCSVFVPHRMDYLHYYQTCSYQ